MSAPKARVNGDPLTVAVQAAAAQHPGGSPAEVIVVFRDGNIGHARVSGFGEDGGQLPDLTPRQGCAAAVCAILRESGRRLTTAEILATLERQDAPWEEQKVKNTLAALVDMGILQNDPRKNPKGYEFSE